MSAAESVRKRIGEVFTSVVPGVDLTTLAEDASLDDFGLDSLDRVELIMELEEEFDITLSDDTSNDINTYGDLCKCIEKVIGGGADG